MQKIATIIYWNWKKIIMFLFLIFVMPFLVPVRFLVFADNALEEKTKTRKKSSVNRKTHGILRKVLADDYKFYYKAKQIFHNLLQRLRKSHLALEDILDR